jgi:subtilisin family serine protease
LNTAVANSIAAGVTYALAAGNSNADACSTSPASTPSALTVGASTSSDQRSSFSNFGTCVDLFAPGSSIYSSVISGGYQSWNGTSMAAPHVAGVAALYLAANPTATAAQVGSAIVGGATPNVLGGIGSGSPNRLLHSLIAGGAVTPPPPPPPPAVVAHVADLTGSSAPVNKKNWRATVAVRVVDAAFAPVANATVTANWSGGTSGSATCTTNGTGTCTMTSGTMNVNKSSATLTVTGIGGSGIGYDAAANVESSVTVSKP